MMTGLGIVLAVSLILFVASLAYAMVQDWFGNNRTFNRMIAEQAAQSGHFSMRRNFAVNARPPVRVLGSFIL
jgi:hypothetical protein